MNLGLAHNRTVEQWGKNPTSFRSGVVAANFKAAGEILLLAKAAAGIKGPVPVQLAEDETGIEQKIEWDPRTDTTEGFCGLHSCVSVQQCRQRIKRQEAGACTRVHQCSSDPAFVMGLDPDAFERTKANCAKRRPASYARALVLNPADPRLPRVVVALIPTCNAFSAAEYVAPQWETAERLYNEHIKDHLGPLVGHASDGDARRRHLMLLAMTSKSGQRYGLAVNTFSLTATAVRDPTGALVSVRGAHDMDFVRSSSTSSCLPPGTSISEWAQGL